MMQIPACRINLLYTVALCRENWTKSLMLQVFQAVIPWLIDILAAGKDFLLHNAGSTSIRQVFRTYLAANRKLLQLIFWNCNVSSHSNTQVRIEKNKWDIFFLIWSKSYQSVKKLLNFAAWKIWWFISWWFWWAFLYLKVWLPICPGESIKYT